MYANLISVGQALITTAIASVSLIAVLRRGRRLTRAGKTVVALLTLSLALIGYGVYEANRERALDLFRVFDDKLNHLLSLRGIGPEADATLDDMRAVVLSQASHVPDRKLCLGVLVKLCLAYTGVGRGKDADSLRSLGLRYARSVNGELGELGRATLLTDAAENALFRLDGANGLKMSSEAESICVLLIADTTRTEAWTDSVLATKTHARRMTIAAYRLCGRDSIAAQRCWDGLRYLNSELAGGRKSTAKERSRLWVTLGSISEQARSLDSAKAQYQRGTLENDSYRPYTDALRARVMARQEDYKGAKGLIGKAEKEYGEYRSRWFALTTRRIRCEIDILCFERVGQPEPDQTEGDLLGLQEDLARGADKRELAKVERDLYHWFTLKGDTTRARHWMLQFRSHRAKCMEGADIGAVGD